MLKGVKKATPESSRRRLPITPTILQAIKAVWQKDPPPGMRGCYGQPLSYVSLGSSRQANSYAQRKSHLTLNPTLPSQTLQWTAGQPHPRCRFASRRPRPIPSSKGLHCISAWQKVHSARWRQCSRTWSPEVATQVRYLPGRTVDFSPVIGSWPVCGRHLPVLATLRRTMQVTAFGLVLQPRPHNMESRTLLFRPWAGGRAVPTPATYELHQKPYKG